MFEKVYGFVCLLIFQSGTSSRILFFSAMDGATHAEARMAGSRVAHTVWRYTCGGQDGRESCRAYGDGATHAEAMDGRESCCAYGINWQKKKGCFTLR